MIEPGRFYSQMQNWSREFQFENPKKGIRGSTKRKFGKGTGKNYQNV